MMAKFNFGGLEQALSETRGSGVSFESQAKKWETEEEGLYTLERILFCFFFPMTKKVTIVIFVSLNNSKRSYRSNKKL